MSIQQIEQTLDDLLEVYPAINKRLEGIESTIKARKWANVPGVNEGKERFSMFRAVMAIKTGDWKEAGYEKSVFEETQKKAMGFETDTLGGYLVPAQAFPELIELLLPNTVCAQLGARIISDLKGSPVLMPKLTGGATVSWIGENTAVDPSNLTTGQIALTPHKAMALVQVSNSLIRMALPAAEAVIRGDMGRQLGLAVDLAALRGTGTSNEPLGIANTPGILTENVGDGTDGATIGNLDLFADMEGALEDADALRGTLGYAFNPTLRRILKKMKVPYFSGDAGVAPLLPLWTFSGVNGDKTLVEALGYPFATTTQIPKNLTKGSSTNCTEVYFGNWEELLIAQWAGLRILASDVAGTAFASDQTWLRIIIEVDVALRHPESFCLCNDLAIS